MDLRKSLRDQATGCVGLGSPFMGRLLHLMADRLQPGSPLTDHLFNWPVIMSPRSDAVPLRLAGGLHAIVLQNPDGELARVYPPNNVDDDQLWHAVETTLDEQSAFLLEWVTLAPQTNEVRRSAALIAAASWLTARLGKPIYLSELGASAGLNLNFDQFALKIVGQKFGPRDPALTLTPDWTGDLPPNTPLNILDNRRGVDLNPLKGADGANRLRAYIWADQPERRHLTDAALACPPALVDRDSVENWLPDRIESAPQNALHLIYHTIAWQYFPKDVQAQCARMIEAQGAKASEDTPMVWLGVEADENPKGAAIRLHLWPGDQKFDLGRMDFHGRWVLWSDEAT